MIKLLSLLVLLLLISPANGMVYSWTDSAGVSHYTNKEYEIPLRYRAKVKARYSEQGDSSIPLLNVEASKAKQNVPTQPQTLQANHPEPVKTLQTDFPLEHQQMKEERAARKARQNKKEDDE